MAKFKLKKVSKLSFTLSNGKAYRLFPEKIYELPKENDYIAGLIGQGYLEPVKTTRRKRKQNGS